MVDTRLWRPAAQRRVRNVWGYIHAQQSAWSSASVAARSAATSLVNAYLSHLDIPAMDLGVLHDLEGIRDKAKIKLRTQQEINMRQYVQAYDALVNSVFEMRQRASSMRTYAKPSGGPLIEFSGDPAVEGDTGDGGGVAVFETLPLVVFEDFAKEIASMFEKELKVKWLLACEFCNLVYPSIEGAEKVPREKDADECEILSTVLNSKSGGKSPPPSRETLQVYLTALLAEVHINKDRIEIISRLWSEEMGVGLVGSQRR